jgi:glutaredoxin
MERGYWTGKNMNLEKYFWVGSAKERRTSPVLFIKKRGHRKVESVLRR